MTSIEIEFSMMLPFFLFRYGSLTVSRLFERDANGRKNEKKLLV